MVFVLYCLGFAELLESVGWCLSPVWKILGHYLFKFCFCPNLSFLSETPTTFMLVFWAVSYMSFLLCSFHCIFSPLCFSWIFLTELYSSLLILSSLWIIFCETHAMSYSFQMLYFPVLDWPFGFLQIPIFLKFAFLPIFWVFLYFLKAWILVILKASFANSNIWIISGSASIVSFFPLLLVTFALLSIV